MEEEVKFLRDILLKTINSKQVLILKKLLKTPGKTLSRVLTELSREEGIPLSTLKFNATILRNHSLIEFYNLDGRRCARVSQLGMKILNMIEGEEDEAESCSTVKVDINEISREVKRDLKSLLKVLNNFHLYSSMTCIDILLGILYHRLVSNRDIRATNIILSKGHATPALYVILEKFGLIRLEEVEAISRPRSIYQTHALKDVPLVKVSTGSLGQGISIANGIALGMKMNREDDYVYVVVGDGEVDEGQIWEAAATSSTYGLDNVVVIIDRNGSQLSGKTEAVKRKEPLALKWRAFGWEVIDITLKGPSDIVYALSRAEKVSNWPKVIIARHG
jgi:transketolase